MTGATSGLGKVAAINAASKGATVIVIARDKAKGVELIADLKKTNAKALGKIEIIEGNLSSLKSVASACQEVRSKYSKLDILVHNAGIMNFSPIQTEDGIEETLQVNLLAPLLISHLLVDLLKDRTQAKIIFTSSGLHQGEINFENLEFKNNFVSFKVYRQSKLGVILLCRLLAKQLNDIGVYCQHPGMVRTNLGRSAGMFSKLIFWLMGKTPEKGAETLSFLIEQKPKDLVSGEYYAYNQVTKTTTQSYDMVVAEKLLKTVQVYLKDYIKEASAVFSK